MKEELIQQCANTTTWPEAFMVVGVLFAFAYMLKSML
jgi:hypothetical protein